MKTKTTSQILLLTLLGGIVLPLFATSCMGPADRAQVRQQTRVENRVEHRQERRRGWD